MASDFALTISENELHAHQHQSLKINAKTANGRQIPAITPAAIDNVANHAEIPVSIDSLRRRLQLLSIGKR